MAYPSYPATLSTLCSVLFLVSVNVMTISTAQADDVKEAVAVNHFQAALNACDRALESPLPKSRGSLRVLQSLLKRYYRNRDDALKLKSNLNESDIYRFTGSYFTETTYAEAYRYCEDRLASKIAQAEEEIAAKQAAREARQQERASEMKRVLAKLEKAKEQVTVAINQHCLSYLRSLDADDELSLGTESPLYPQYQAAQRQAIAIYPQILKQFHDVTIVDPELNEEQTETKTVEAWFIQCDEAFTSDIEEDLLAGDGELDTTTMMEVLEEGVPIEDDGDSLDTGTIAAEAAPEPSADLEGPIMPPLPPSAELPTTDAIDPDPIDDAPLTEERDFIDAEIGNDDTLTDDSGFADNTGANTDEDYLLALETLQGDKRVILQKEGRSPDDVNDPDFDIVKSNVWQYEALDGNRCTIYTFKGNDRLKTTSQGGECPGF